MAKMVWLILLLLLLLPTGLHAQPVPISPGDDSTAIAHFNAMMDSATTAAWRNRDPASWQHLMDAAQESAAGCNKCLSRYWQFQARLAIYHGEFDAATDHKHLAMRYAEADGDSAWIASCMMLEVEIANVRGDKLRAIPMMERVLGIYLRHGAYERTGPVYFRLAMMRSVGNDQEGALHYYRLAALEKNTSSKSMQAHHTYTLALTFSDKSNIPNAPESYADSSMFYLQKARRLAEEEENRDVVINCMKGEARVLYRQGIQLERAEELLDSALQIAVAYDFDRHLVGIQMDQALLLSNTNRCEQAIVILDQMGDNATRIGGRFAAYEVAQMRYRCLMQQSDTNAALEWLEQMHLIVDTTESRELQQHLSNLFANTELLLRETNIREMKEIAAEAQILALQEEMTRLTWQLGLGALLLVAIGALLVFRVRNHRKQLKVQALELQLKRALLRPTAISRSMADLQQQLTETVDRKELLASFSHHTNLLRYQLDCSIREFIPLRDELSGMDAQLTIDNRQRHCPATLTHNLQELPNLLVPAQVIQVFTGRAMNHFTEDQDAPQMTIQASLCNDQTLEVCIQDNGTIRASTSNTQAERSLIEAYLELKSSSERTYGLFDLPTDDGNGVRLVLPFLPEGERPLG